MELSCDRCLARLSTSEEPVPGRAYRVPCACGHTLIVELDAPLASAELELARSTTEDPFARALPRRNGRVEVTTPLHEGRLAERDPDAVPEETSGDGVTGALSFDDLLRRARAHGFLLGAAAGAIGAVVVAAALALATARPTGTTTIPVREPLAAPATAPAPPAEPSREPPPATRRAPTARRAGAEVASARGAPGERPPARAERGPAETAVPAEELPAPADASEVMTRGTTAAASPEPTLTAAAAPAETAGAERTAGDSPAAFASALAGTGTQAGVPERAGATPGPASRALEPSAASRPRRPFPEEDVAAALRSRRPAVSECIAATPGGPSAARARRFSLTVVIDPSGRVSEVFVDDPEVQETPLGQCLLRHARTMSFAPFDGSPYRVELALDYGDAG
jgi:hypothetical protein